MGRYVNPHGAPNYGGPFLKPTRRNVMKKLWIRPVHDKVTDRLLSIAVCTTKYDVLVDEQILEHFSPQMTGAEVRDSYPDHTMFWGPPIVALT